jgi:microcystin-dependent protein
MSTGIYVGLSSGNVGIGTGGINGVGSQLNVNGDISAGFLIGQVSFFTMSTAPTGWLKCNGAAISRTTYAKLFAVTGTTYGVGNGSTTFNLPDLRGEFIRGWDDARAVDSGRTFGTAQAAGMLNHTHTGTTEGGGSHSHTGVIVPEGGAPQGLTYDGGINVRCSSTNTTSATVAAHTHTMTTGNPSTGGGTETRPRNVALLACIKF